MENIIIGARKRLAETGTPTTSEVIINASVGNTDEGVLGLSDVVGEDWYR